MEKSPFIIGVQMNYKWAVFNSYVKLPEGNDGDIHGGIQIDCMGIGIMDFMVKSHMFDRNQLGFAHGVCDFLNSLWGFHGDFRS